MSGIPPTTPTYQYSLSQLPTSSTDPATSLRTEADLSPEELRKLGIKHALGEGVERDIDKALDVLSKAEAKGDEKAILLIGIIKAIFEVGNPDEALIPLLQRSEGNAEMQFCLHKIYVFLGKKYRESHEGERYAAQAKEWLKGAARLSHPLALSEHADDLVQSSEFTYIFHRDLQKEWKTTLQRLHNVKDLLGSGELFAFEKLSIKPYPDACAETDSEHISALKRICKKALQEFNQLRVNFSEVRKDLPWGDVAGFYLWTVSKIVEGERDEFGNRPFAANPAATFLLAGSKLAHILFYSPDSSIQNVREAVEIEKAISRLVKRTQDIYWVSPDFKKQRTK